MKKDIKNELVKLITDKIEKDNLLPWQKGTLNSTWFPINGFTKKNYRGINLIVLSFLGGANQEFLTFKQVQEKGGKVKKGAKSLPVLYWQPWNFKEHRAPQEGDNKEDVAGFYKQYNVFDISQTEGIEPSRKLVKRENVEHNEEIENIIKEFAKNTKLNLKIETSTKIGNNSAYYSPTFHEVYIAPCEEYTTTEQWLSTFFHELVHSTAKALKRKIDGHKFGSYEYSKEEIVAEFGATMLCRIFGVNAEVDNSAVYIKSWSKKLKENPDWLISGANEAQKAVDYILEKAGYKMQEG